MIRLTGERRPCAFSSSAYEIRAPAPAPGGGGRSEAAGGDGQERHDGPSVSAGGVGRGGTYSSAAYVRRRPRGSGRLRRCHRYRAAESRRRRRSWGTRPADGSRAPPATRTAAPRPDCRLPPRLASRAGSGSTSPGGSSSASRSPPGGALLPRRSGAGCRSRTGRRGRSRSSRRSRSASSGRRSRRRLNRRDTALLPGSVAIAVTFTRWTTPSGGTARPVGGLGADEAVAENAAVARWPRRRSGCTGCRALSPARPRTRR